MTFLNPVFLWALLGLAIPIIVHLFNFRKPKLVIFSNVELVKQVSKIVVRRLKLKQYLLLLLRLLAVGAVVLAFANPVLVSENQSTLLQSNASVVIVLDNSLSMTASDENGQYFQQVKMIAQEIIKAYSQADEFQLLTTANVRLNAEFIPKNQLAERLEIIDFQQKTISHSELTSKIPELFTRASNPRKIVFFLSDFQKSTILSTKNTDEKNPQTTDLKGYEIYYIPIGNRPQPNIYISNVEIENQLVEKGKPLKIQLTLNNDSEQPVTNLSIKLEVKGKATAIASESLEPHQTKPTTLTFIPEGIGWQSGVITIEDGHIEFDNKRYFNFYVPDKAKVLIIEGEKGSEYLRLFFQKLVNQYEAVFVSEKAAATVSLPDYSTVILVGLQDLSTGLSERLTGWVKEGGGLMFFPSESMNMTSINAFYKNLQIGQFTGYKSFKPAQPFAKPDIEHLLFQGVYTNLKEKGNFDSPMINNMCTFVPENQGVQTIIIKNQLGEPVLTEAKTGAGTVLTFTIFPDLHWSDFPIKTAFAPIIYRSMLILNNVARTDNYQTLGNFALKHIKTSRKELIKLKMEQKQEVIPEQYAQGGNIVLKFDKSAVEAGNYQIMQADSALGAVSFNLPDAESKLTNLNANVLKEYLDKNGYTNINVTKSTPQLIKSALEEGRMGIPLWKYFVICCLLMLAGEVLVLKLYRKG